MFLFHEFSANEPINDSILVMLRNQEVPKEWASNDKFTNQCDMTEQWHTALLNCLTQMVTENRPGKDKKENKDFYAFSMEPKFQLSKSLQESGWRQYSCTIRLAQLKSEKAKRTHYTFHFWAIPTPCGIDYNKTILLKLKLEGKFIPSTQEEQQMIVDLTHQYLNQ